MPVALSEFLNRYVTDSEGRVSVTPGGNIYFEPLLHKNMGEKYLGQFLPHWQGSCLGTKTKKGQRNRKYPLTPLLLNITQIATNIGCGY